MAGQLIHAVAEAVGVLAGPVPDTTPNGAGLPASGAIEKILSPHDVGLWWRPGSFGLPRLTVDGPGPPGTRELLGWWIVPAGLAACVVLLFATKQFARWWIRRSRASAASVSR